MTKGLNATYDDSQDCWQIVVPFMLSRNAVNNAAKHLAELWTSLLPTVSKATHPDRHERIVKGIAAARAGRIQQVLVGKKEVTIFQSTEKMNPNRTIYT